MTTVIEPGVAVVGEPDAWNRIQAYWAGMEFLGHCTLSWLSVTYTGEGENRTEHVSGGPLDILQRMQDERSRTPGVEFLLICDKTIRDLVYRLRTREPQIYPSMSHALRAIIQEHKYIWGECRSDAREAHRSRGTKRSAGGEVVTRALTDRPQTLSIADTNN